MVTGKEFEFVKDYVADLKEMEDGTYKPRDRKLANKSFGHDVVRNIKI